MEDRGNNADFIAHGIEVLASQGLGQERRADLLFDELARRVESIPGHGMQSWLREVRGRLAVARGQLSTGLAELELAAAALPNLDDSMPRVWFALGEAGTEGTRRRPGIGRNRTVQDPARASH